MDPRRASPRTKPLPKFVPDKKALGSRSKLANKNAGKWGTTAEEGEAGHANFSWRYISDNASSDGDLDYNVPKVEVYDNYDNSYDELNNKSRAQLLEMLQESDRKIKVLELELVGTKCKQRENTKQIWENYNWAGGEANFADTVNQFCKQFLFPWYKLLKEGWQDFQPEKKNSLFSLVKQNLSIPKGANNRDIWDRVIVPSKWMKYISIKCNLDN